MGTLLVIAGTSGPFADFGPYVPSINDRGMVAFQATRRGSTTGIFCGDGGPISYLRPAATYHSHPAINNHGTLCAYADTPEDGTQAVIFGVAGGPAEIITHEALKVVGPLGPTMNDAGSIAFRATSAAGRAGIYVAGDGPLVRVAETDERFGTFDGLPVILGDGSVVFRANHVDGIQAIHRWRPGGRTTSVVTTGERFVELGRFPDANAHGTVVFTATQRDGSSGVFTAREGIVETAIESARQFESFRGALIDDDGRIVFYATPSGGMLGIHALDTAGPRRLICLRDEFGTCPLTDFALNPVSLNNAGQVALRLKLADGRQFIARLDVFG